MTFHEILRAALALSTEERVVLIQELEASLASDTTLAVIEERVASARAGAKGIPAEEVFAEARRR